MNWSFKREESTGFSTNIPEGKHRVRIKSAKKDVSKNSGNDMLVLELEVNGYPNESVFNYITFLDDKPEITNRMLTQFFDSFKDIPEGDFNMNNWIGKVGACTIKHSEYNDNISAKVGYFIPANRQTDLPAWKGAPTDAGAGTDFGSSEGVDIPF